MAVFVLVHGAFGGGWEWREVANILRRRGHEAFAPTLTGLGERAHLGGPRVDLSTHVADLLGLLQMEDVRDVVVCAASYGGMPATGAVDRAPGQVARLIYVDALVPLDGQSALDLLSAAFGDLVRASAEADPDGWRVAVPDAVLPPADLVGEPARSRYVARLRPQPIATFTQPLRLAGAVDRVPRAFLRCTQADLGVALDHDPIAPFAARARKEGWSYREVATPHDPHLVDPEGTARMLEDLAGE